MTTLSADEISALFVAVGQPSDTFVQTMIKTLTPVLLQIPFDITNGGQDSLLALISTDAEYVNAFGHPFTILPQVGFYDITILPNATGRVRAERKSLHTRGSKIA